jgi:lysophospholipase L1-like esterase
VGTLLPSTVTGFNTERDTVNATIRTWVGVHADAIADFAADPTMGPDSAAASTTLYSDGTHPTDAGYVLLERVLQPVINGL